MTQNLDELKNEVIAKYVFHDDDLGFHLIVYIDGVKKFATAFQDPVERQRALDDILQMIRESGGRDLPTRRQ